MENFSGFEGGKELKDNSGNSLSELRKKENVKPEGHDFGGDGNGTPEKSDDNFPAQEFLGVKSLMKISWGMLAERINKLCAAVILYLILFVAAFMFVIAVYIAFQSLVLTLISGILSLVLILFTVFVYNIVIIEILEDKSIGIKNAIKKSSPKIVPYVKCTLVFIAFFFALLLPLLVSGVVYGAAAAILPAGADPQMAQSPINILNWIIGIFLFAYTIAFLLISFVMSAWQSFAFFSTVTDGRMANESVAYAYGMVKHRKKGITWRISVFFILYFALMVVLKDISEDNLIMSIILQIINIVMGLWMYAFSYAMYKNIKAMHGTEVDSRDIETVKKFVKVGVAGIILAILAGGAMLAYVYSDFMDRSGTDVGNQNNSTFAIKLQYESVGGILDA